MKISLGGWSSRGLRCPDVDVSLLNADGKPARVALIQMPNGTGKTTTLELLRRTLTGQGDRWTPQEVRALRRPGEDNEDGSFKVTLLMDERPLTIEMTLDFEEGTVAYGTTWPGSGGLQRRYNPPPAILKFLTPAFLDLFIFDGEFADRLLKESAGKADEAIDALCRLDLVEQIKATAHTQWQSKTSQGGPKSAQALTRLQQQEQTLSKRLGDLQTARTKAIAKIEQKSELAASLEKKIADRLSSVESTQAAHAAAQLALQGATSAVSSAAGDVMAGMRMPLALHPVFSTSLIELKDNLDNLKLPENTSAQFFSDLVREVECICGRPMTDPARQEILNRSKGYLDADESGTINALKHQIEAFVTPDGEETPHQRLQVALDTLASASRARKEADQTLQALARQLVEAGDEELRGWQSELKEAQTELSGCQALLDDVDNADEEDHSGPIASIKLADRKLKEVNARIAELTQTVELKRKTDLLSGILDRAATLARAQIRKDLVKESNEKLKTILSNDPLRIDRIDRSLHLAHQSDASVGQKLSVGYTFLMSALSRGDNDFPLIVDSPANPIDEQVRRSIGKVIPELCTQFVGFTINTERAGFVQALDAATKDCIFYTIFRKTAGTERLQANLPAQGVEETDTAFVVRDREYFMSFDVTTQGEG